MISFILLLPILVPLGAAVFLMLYRSASERATSAIAISSVGAMAASAAVAAIFTTLAGERALDLPLFRWHDSQFEFRLFLDFAGGVFLTMTLFLGAVVMRFSHFYMHREPGHRRFFATLLLFLSGMAIVSLGADLETFFMGWEMVGISSFILIGFYRGRSQPVRNAQKVYAIYRLCDVGLLLGAFLEHKLLPGVSFRDLADPALIAQLQGLGSLTLLSISALLLLSASGKSAQIPFSFWIPRAMEGPTPSSAIFYGALSIHAGVFLLMRTYPIWHASAIAPYLVGAIGGATALLATGMSRVQSNIKGQIGYASVTQVGLMFVEISLGFPKLALLHFVSNACLRCYQLLVSPSVVAYLLRLQSTAVGPRARFSDWSIERLLPIRVRSTLYVIMTSEGYLPHLIEGRLWQSMKQLAERIALIPVAILGAAALAFAASRGLATELLFPLSLFMIAAALALKALAGRGLAIRAWLLSSAASLFLAGGVAWGNPETLHEILPFAVGIVLCAAIGIFSLRARSETGTFLSLLGLTGFPISPVFFGEDLVLHASLALHPALALIFTLVFIINGIALIRAFSQTFLTERAIHAAS